jgi:RecB family exonuclease
MTTRFTITAPEPLPRQGRYVDPETGETHARVSTIIGTLAKPGIGIWRERLIREGRDPDAVGREAANRGTAIHRLTELADLAEPLICPPEYQPFLDAWCAWRDAHVAHVLMVEETVLGRRRGLLYGGTIDRLLTLTDGRTALVDLKTGKNLDPTIRLQQVAYSDALDEAGVEVDVRLIAHLPSDRPGELTIITLDDDAGDRAAWRHLLALYYWQRDAQRAARRLETRA